MLNRPVEWFADIDFADADDTKTRIAAEFEGWAPELRALITDADTTPILRGIHQLPDRHRWARMPGVTLLGDAAHVTVPGGEGANIAMLDGAELGEAIAAHPGDVEAAFAAYEEVMFARSEAEAVAARETIDLIFRRRRTQRTRQPVQRHRLDPVRQGAVVEAQVSRDLCDRLPSLPHDPDRALAELRIEPPSHLSHEPLSLKFWPPRYEGNRTTAFTRIAAIPAPG